jgi:hypothetical protein
MRDLTIVDAKNAPTVRRAMRDAVRYGHPVLFGGLISLELALSPMGWLVRTRASRGDVWSPATNVLSFDDAVTVVTNYARNREG